jgi:ribonuclease VapC
MIAIDSSVFVAIIANEDDSVRLVRTMAAAERRVMSAGNYLECAIVAESRFGGRPTLDNWLRRRRVEIMAVDESMARDAADAFARFGKGRHLAALNHGDCFAYALAKSLDAPLLYKGDDFSRTDIRPALA